MRNTRHHSIIVTTNDKAALAKLRLEIIAIYQSKMEAKNGAQLISPIVESLINNHCSFFIAPDGSKEGYDASEDGDNVRKHVVSLIESKKDKDGNNVFYYVEVYYGDDNGKAEILNHN
ncbi:MAG: hypothetical protein SFY32_15910 [Bacteroidota bacterium]|nr:hypothetical protein [Bacteroidota bacterium]